MRRVAPRLHAWEEGELRALAVLRMGLPLILVLYIDTFTESLWQFVDFPRSLWDPVSFAALAGGTPSQGAMHILLLACLAGCLLLAAGWKTRVVGPALAVLAMWLAVLTFSFGKVDPTPNLVLLLLFVLSFSPWGARWSLDARSAGPSAAPPPTRFAHWPFYLATMVLTLPYLSAGLLKVVGWSGQHAIAMDRFLDWIETIEGRGAVQRPGPAVWAGDWVVAHPVVSAVSGYLAPIVEGWWVLALLSSRLRIAFLWGLVAFQAFLSSFSGIAVNAAVYCGFLVAGALTLLALRPRVPSLARAFPAAPVAAASQEGHRMEHGGAAAWTAAALAFVAAMAIARFVAIAGFVPTDDLIPGLSVGNGSQAVPKVYAVALAVGVAGFLIGLAIAARSAWRVLSAPAAGGPSGALHVAPDSRAAGVAAACSAGLAAGGVQVVAAAGETRFEPAGSGGQPAHGALALAAALQRSAGPRRLRWRLLGLLLGLDGVRHVVDRLLGTPSQSV